MASTYIFYVEANIDGKWYCINSLVKHFNDSYENKFEYVLADTYWSGSRSYFSRAYDKFYELGSNIKFSDLSDELKQRYSTYVEKEANNEENWIKPIAVYFDDLVSYVDEKKFDKHGLVHKDKIFSYEHGDLEELYETDSSELSGLTEQQLSAYSYYEWDDKFEWNWGLKEVKRFAVFDVNRFEASNIRFCDEKINYRIIGIGG